MRFSYSVKSKDGILQTGFLEAPTREIAVANLQGAGFVILNISEQKKEGILETFFNLFKGVSSKDLAVFTKQFSVLIGGQVPLVDSLRTLNKQTSNFTLKNALLVIASDVEAGLTLSQAMGRHHIIFSQFFVKMVETAESVGKLDEVFLYLAVYYEREAKLVSRARNSMIYPAFILFIFVGVMVLMLIFVIPQFKTIFEEAGAQLPIFTRIIVGLSDFMINFWWALVLFVVGGGWILYRYAKSSEGHEAFDWLFLKMPVIGNVFKKIYIIRFAESVATLTRGGIPLATGVEIASGVVGSSIYGKVILYAAEALRKGNLMSDVLSNFPEIFPPVVSQMIAIGERTGRVDELLRKVASFYNEDVEVALSNFVELLQPFLIVILAIGVGILEAAILLPIYSLGSTV